MATYIQNKVHMTFYVRCDGVCAYNLHALHNPGET